MATVADLVARARRQITGTRREPYNSIVADMPASSTDPTLSQSVEHIHPGSRVGINAELWIVTAVHPDLDSIDIIRGVDGTPIPATHPALSVVEVDWRFFTADFLGFLVDEIRSWPDSIFAVLTEQVSIGISSRSVDLPLTRYRYPLEVLRKLAITAGHPSPQWHPTRDYRITIGLPTAEFPSGNALIVPGNPVPSSYLVTYASSFDLTNITDLTTDLDTVPLSERLYDAAVYGVCWRALAADEASRSSRTDQPEPRQAEEVEAGDAVASAGAYKTLRDERLAEEVSRLRTLYPPRGV